MDLFYYVQGLFKKVFKKSYQQYTYAMRSLENIPDGVFWIDENSRILYVNRAACKMLGYSKEELTRMTVMQITGSPEYESPDNLRQLANLVIEGKLTSFITYHKHRDGHIFPVEIVCASVSATGEAEVGICFVRDITERLQRENEITEMNCMLKKELENHKKTEELLRKVNEELENSAYTDQLTNVWNRRCLTRNINAQLDLIQEQKEKISLLILDLDNFKKVNDRYGHQVGDKVLIEFTELIKLNIRNTDSITRWGGEEFLIVVPGLDSQRAFDYAERLRKAVESHIFSFVGHITVSIGVAELKENEDIDNWIKRVDDALYKAKSTNRNRVEIG